MAESTTHPPAARLEDRVFVGLNGRVIALDRGDGRLLWSYDTPRGSGFVSILLDGDQLIVGVAGFIYCLDPLDGSLLWKNPLRGFGRGLTSLVSHRGSTSPGAAEQALREMAAAAAAAST